MRVGELSKRSGVPVPTIKYYLREGLLPAGVLTSPNQAHYDDEHLRRLRLVRALIDVGGLSIATVREVLGVVDSHDDSLHEKLGAVQEAISQPGPGELDPLAIDDVQAFFVRQGEDKCDDVTESNVTHMLAAALTAARSVGHDHFRELLDPYLEGSEDHRAGRRRLHRAARVRATTSSRRWSSARSSATAVIKAVRRLAHVPGVPRRDRRRPVDPTP